MSKLDFEDEYVHVDVAEFKYLHLLKFKMPILNFIIFIFSFFRCFFNINIWSFVCSF